MNSRAKLFQTEEPPYDYDNRPSNTNRGKGTILENVYKPGFIDNTDIEQMKISVDAELNRISNAFLIEVERTVDGIVQTRKLEIEDENNKARIEEVDRVSKAGDVSLAQRITTVEASFGAGLDDAKAYSEALVSSESTARASADEALGTRIDTVKAEFDVGLADGLEAGKNFTTAAVTSEAEARANADGALGSRIDTVTATFNKDLADGVDAAKAFATASVSSEATARANADSAIGSRIDTVKAELDGSVASVKVTAEAGVAAANAAQGTANAIGAKWGVTVDVNGNVAGISLNNNGASSEFNVVADKFSFTDATTKLKPFYVQGGKVHTRDLDVHGTLYAEDIVGDIAAIVPWHNSASNVSTSTNLSILGVSKAMPFDRVLLFNCGLWTSNSSGSTLTMWVYKNDVVDTQKQIVASPGQPIPVCGILTIPANWTGSVRIALQNFNHSTSPGYYTGGQGFAIATKWALNF